MNPGSVLWCFSGGRMRARYGQVELLFRLATPTAVRADGSDERYWCVKPLEGHDLRDVPEFYVCESHLAATREELEQRFPVAPKAAPSVASSLRRSVASSDAQLDLFAEAV